MISNDGMKYCKKRFWWFGQVVLVPFFFFAVIYKNEKWIKNNHFKHKALAFFGWLVHRIDWELMGPYLFLLGNISCSQLIAYIHELRSCQYFNFRLKISRESSTWIVYIALLLMVPQNPYRCFRQGLDGLFSVWLCLLYLYIDNLKMKGREIGS